jgi:hormone-sensitive lipase
VARAASAEGLPYAFKGVQVRLLSFTSRDGQITAASHIKNYDAYARNNAGRWESSVSNALIVHIHGGGFVAQSSQSHEVLR